MIKATIGFVAALFSAQVLATDLVTNENVADLNKTGSAQRQLQNDKQLPITPSLEVLMFLGEFTDTDGHLVDPRTLKIITKLDLKKLDTADKQIENDNCANTQGSLKTAPKNEPNLIAKRKSNLQTYSDVCKTKEDDPIRRSAIDADANKKTYSNEDPTGANP